MKVSVIKEMLKSVGHKGYSKLNKADAMAVLLPYLDTHISHDVMPAVSAEAVTVGDTLDQQPMTLEEAEFTALCFSSPVSDTWLLFIYALLSFIGSVVVYGLAWLADRVLSLAQLARHHWSVITVLIPSIA